MCNLNPTYTRDPGSLNKIENAALDLGFEFKIELTDGNWTIMQYLSGACAIETPFIIGADESSAINWLNENLSEGADDVA
jgi:hypothetical protein